MDTWESKRETVKEEDAAATIEKHKAEGWRYEGMVTYAGGLDAGYVICQFSRGFFDKNY